MVWSPLPATSICYAIFRWRIRVSGADEDAAFRPFVRYVASVAGVAVAIEVVGTGVWIASMENASGNSPLAVIIYALPALALGELVGCAAWMRAPISGQRYMTVIRRFGKRRPEGRDLHEGARADRRSDSELELEGELLEAVQRVLKIADFDHLPLHWKIPEQSLAELSATLDLPFDTAAEYYLYPRAKLVTQRLVNRRA